LTYIFRIQIHNTAFEAATSQIFSSMSLDCEWLRDVEILYTHLAYLPKCYKNMQSAQHVAMANHKYDLKKSEFPNMKKHNFANADIKHQTRRLRSYCDSYKQQRSLEF
jgi:hypothetical protein